VKGNVPAVNFYMSDWGEFEMPLGLYEKTKWRYVEVETMSGRRIVSEPAPTSDNHEFFTWLHGEEVKAGKPE